MAELARIIMARRSRRTPMAKLYRRAELAQVALDAYLHAEGAARRWGDSAPPCDIVDLMTDLLLLAKDRGHDPCSVMNKVEQHLKSKSGERC
jgi:NADPH-dependent ferric siderophore reductase